MKNLNQALADCRRVWPNDHFSAWAASWIDGSDRSVDAAECALSHLRASGQAPEPVERAAVAALYYAKAEYECGQAGKLLVKLINERV